jgi:hypothetical protein
VYFGKYLVGYLKKIQQRRLCISHGVAPSFSGMFMDRRGNDCRTSGFRFWIAPSLPRLDHIPVLHQNAILDPENVRGYPIYWQAETRKPARSETQAHRITGDPSAIV